jgi:hypothetical protein
MQDFDYDIGTAPFSARAFRQNQKLQLGITVESSRGIWAEVFDNRLVDVDSNTLLSSLISFWPKIAGPYAGFPATRFQMDLSLLAGYLPEGKVIYIRDGHEVSFTFDGQSKELGSESVIPVEVLLALGNLIASDAPAHLKVLWNRASSQTELPPFSLSRREDMGRPEEDAEAETDWYAAALGQDRDIYRRTANWLHARQLAFAVGNPEYSEPTAAEYNVLTIPSHLPSDADIDAIYTLSASKLNASLDDLRKEAISQRNSDARNVTVFRRFFPSGSKADRTI